MVEQKQKSTGINHLLCIERKKTEKVTKLSCDENLSREKVQSNTHIREKRVRHYTSLFSILLWPCTEEMQKIVTEQFVRKRVTRFNTYKHGTRKQVLAPS